VAGAILVATVIGACAGTKPAATVGSRPSTTFGTTADEFVARSDVICQKYEPQLKAITPPGDPAQATGSQFKAWSTYFGVLRSDISEMLVELFDVPVPATNAAAVTDWDSKLKVVYADIAQTQSLADSGASGVDVLSAFKQSFSKLGQDSGSASAAARAIRLKICGA
jgi:hypothetical protein